MTDNRPQLLIVEDDADLSEMVSSYFRAQQYDVVVAAWGEEALSIAAENPLDLAMLDIRLPDIDGFELCRRLRENRRTQDLPIIFLTEKNERQDKLQGLEMGVVDYITKPFDIQELRLRVRNAISRARQTSRVNPVTELPEHEPVTERLAQVLAAGRTVALLQFSIESLGDFRERYGFVAADDVLRAVTLMVRNAVREFGEDQDFIGHLEPEVFLIITAPDAVDLIQERIQRRIIQSREYFYPLRDRERAQAALQQKQLAIKSVVLTVPPEVYPDVEALKAALHTMLMQDAGE
ncbi:MAG: response regulator [Anaerolineae bacterium]|nr:response regulator [Anaerolineae bacterium]